ncbi:hypothetical protein [Chryseobacterium sp.]|uniref:hypothetical protein n=1 Tax=Chryseobacterium sp. TaxID=1871047 RepID=UPI00321B9649
MEDNLLDLEGNVFTTDQKQKIKGYYERLIRDGYKNTNETNELIKKYKGICENYFIIDTDRGWMKHHVTEYIDNIPFGISFTIEQKDIDKFPIGKNLYDYAVEEINKRMLEEEQLCTFSIIAKHMMDNLEIENYQTAIYGNDNPNKISLSIREEDTIKRQYEYNYINKTISLKQHKHQSRGHVSLSFDEVRNIDPIKIIQKLELKLKNQTNDF